MAATKRTGRRRRERLGRDELDAMLKPTSTTRERIEGMLALGLTAGQLATVTGATESSVRNWTGGTIEPRPEAAMALDYLRATIKTLLEGGMDPERALRWLTSLDPQRFGEERPIEIMETRPSRVLAEALSSTLEGPAEEHEPALG